MRFYTLFTWFLLSVLSLRIILTRHPVCLVIQFGMTRKGKMEGGRNNNTRSLPVDRKSLYSNLPRNRLCYYEMERVERAPLFESFILNSRPTPLLKTKPNFNCLSVFCKSLSFESLVLICCRVLSAGRIYIKSHIIQHYWHTWTLGGEK